MTLPWSVESIRMVKGIWGRGAAVERERWERTGPLYLLVWSNHRLFNLVRSLDGVYLGCVTEADCDSKCSQGEATGTPGPIE